MKRASAQASLFQKHHSTAQTIIMETDIGAKAFKAPFSEREIAAVFDVCFVTRIQIIDSDYKRIDLELGP